MNGNFTAPQCAQSQSRWRTPPRGSRRGRKRPEGGERDCKRDARRNWLWLRLRRPFCLPPKCTSLAASAALRHPAAAPAAPDAAAPAAPAAPAAAAPAVVAVVVVAVAARAGAHLQPLLLSGAFVPPPVRLLASASCAQPPRRCVSVLSTRPLPAESAPLFRPPPSPAPLPDVGLLPAPPAAHTASSQACRVNAAHAPRPPAACVFFLQLLLSAFAPLPPPAASYEPPPARLFWPSLLPSPLRPSSPSSPTPSAAAACGRQPAVLHAQPPALSLAPLPAPPQLV
mmetsp:Transcript_41247/g.102238  ORF Transcript_41247/g.102238 Transcript_41247/m.102238 type:complete len:284 (+) Transcript_41247:131-982(+)